MATTFGRTDRRLRSFKKYVNLIANYASRMTEKWRTYNWIHDLTCRSPVMGRKCLPNLFWTKRLHNIHRSATISLWVSNTLAYRKHDCSRWLEWLLFDSNRASLREALWNGIFYFGPSGKRDRVQAPSADVIFHRQQKKKENPTQP